MNKVYFAVIEDSWLAVDRDAFQGGYEELTLTDDPDFAEPFFSVAEANRAIRDFTDLQHPHHPFPTSVVEA